MLLILTFDTDVDVECWFCIRKMFLLVLTLVAILMLALEVCVDDDMLMFFVVFQAPLGDPGKEQILSPIHFRPRAGSCPSLQHRTNSTSPLQCCDPFGLQTLFFV